MSLNSLSRKARGPSSPLSPCGRGVGGEGWGKRQAPLTPTLSRKGRGRKENRSPARGEGTRRNARPQRERGEEGMLSRQGKEDRTESPSAGIEGRRFYSPPRRRGPRGPRPSAPLASPPRPPRPRLKPPGGPPIGGPPSPRQFPRPKPPAPGESAEPPASIRVPGDPGASVASLFWPVNRSTSATVRKPSALRSICLNSSMVRPLLFHSYRPICASVSLSSC